MIATLIRLCLVAVVVPLLISGCASLKKDSRHGITSIKKQGDTIEFTLNVKKGRVYALEETDDLLNPNWQLCGQVVTADTKTATLYHNPGSEQIRYYRLVEQ